jgi:transcriptional regulator with XRE-family HTH domain
MTEDGFDPAVSPVRVFGAMLRFYRTQAGLSQTDLGARLHFSGDLVSKIEAGHRIASEEFAAACDGLPNLGTGGALAELRGLMKEAIRNRALPGWFVDWPRKEALARSLRWFEVVSVPGLLQTEEYARAVLRTQVMATEEQVEDMVRARMERQSILAREHPPMFWVLIDECVLRRPVGGGEVMAGQLGRLAEVARQPNIVLQAIPLAAGAHQGMSGNFVIADFAQGPPAVYQDTAVRGQITEDPDDIAKLTVMWETLKAEALSRSASQELIEEAGKSWT